MAEVGMVRRYLTYGVLVPLFVVLVLVGPFGSPAHADTTYCNAMVALQFGSGNILPYRLCVTHVVGRGNRGYVEFGPPQPYQLAGRFFVTLARNGNRVDKTTERVNPIVNDATTWPTAYVQTGNGHYCVRAWERRTPTRNELIREACHDLP